MSKAEPDPDADANRYAVSGLRDGREPVPECANERKERGVSDNTLLAIMFVSYFVLIAIAVIVL